MLNEREAKQIRELEESVVALLTKVEDLENLQLDIPSKLVLLTPSNTLEDVKGRVNQIINIINGLSVN